MGPGNGGRGIVFRPDVQRADNGLFALLTLGEALGVSDGGHRVRLRPARDENRNEIGSEVAIGYGVRQRQGFRNVTHHDGTRDLLEGFVACRLVIFRQGRLDARGGLLERQDLQRVNRR